MEYENLRVCITYKNTMELAAGRT